MIRDGEKLAEGYRLAGKEFLAAKLEGMFRKIVTPEDQALHNLIQEEVFLMIGSETREVHRFYKDLARRILLGEERKPDDFLWIRMFGVGFIFRNKAKNDSKIKKIMLRKIAKSILSRTKG